MTWWSNRRPGGAIRRVLAPERRIEIIAGTPAGGGQDRAARALAQALPIETFVTNVPGRGGGNGWDLLAGRTGDPHVVSISSPTLITNKLRGEASIDHVDLTPLAHLCTESLVFAVRSDRANPDPEMCWRRSPTGKRWRSPRPGQRQPRRDRD
jgi:putative tricarboxylic transport membrane protein